MLIYDTATVKVLRVSNTCRFLSDIRERNVVWFVSKGKKILVDPGIIKWYKKITSTFPEVDEIWLTHYHPDHAWAAGLYAKYYGCEVVRGPATDYQIAENGSLFIKKEFEKSGSFIEELFSSWSQKYADIIMSVLYGKNYPTTIEMFLPDSDDLTVEYLSGHTTSEANFLMKIGGKKVMVAGDLLQRRSGQALMPLNLPKSSLISAFFSLKTLRDLEVDILIPGHGDIIETNEQVVQLITQAEKKYLAYLQRIQAHIKVCAQEYIEYKPSLDELALMVPFEWPRKYNPSILERQCLALAALRAMAIREI